ncbi:MAG TPA: polyhydroxyalkanoate depolymerase, partial [Burkholderiaceae bacterium]|nr:polyhydroxyalkanoate depolymerase [Burkholderiaceae bacterium]
MMYQAYQAQSDLLRPLRHLAKVHGAMLGTEPPQPGLANVTRPSMAASKVFELSEVTHRRPPWRIASVTVKGEEQAVVEEIALRTPFAELLRLRKPGVTGQPKLLV